MELGQLCKPQTWVITWGWGTASFPGRLSPSSPSLEGDCQPCQLLLCTQTFPVSSSVLRTHNFLPRAVAPSVFSVCELIFQGRHRPSQRAASILSDPPHSPTASGWHWIVTILLPQGFVFGAAHQKLHKSFFWGRKSHLEQGVVSGLC